MIKQVNIMIILLNVLLVVREINILVVVNIFLIKSLGLIQQFCFVKIIWWDCNIKFGFIQVSQYIKAIVRVNRYNLLMEKLIGIIIYFLNFVFFKEVCSFLLEEIFHSCYLMVNLSKVKTYQQYFQIRIQFDPYLTFKKFNLIIYKYKIISLIYNICVNTNILFYFNL